jgi:hypothetical protein
LLLSGQEAKGIVTIEHDVVRAQGAFRRRSYLPVLGRGVELPRPSEMPMDVLGALI